MSCSFYGLYKMNIDFTITFYIKILNAMFWGIIKLQENCDY